MSERSISRAVVRQSSSRWFVGAYLLLGVALPLLYLSRPLHFDEAIYLAIAEQVANGQALYVDVADHKPPGIYVLAAVAFEVFDAPLYALRLATYAVVAVSALLVAALGRRLRDRPTGLFAGLLYLLMTYLPHFDGFYFLTEPWAVLTLLVATLLLFDDRRGTDALAGGSLAVGVLFNQTVFLFGAAIIAFHLLKLRYPDLRTREYLLGTVRRLLTIGSGFLVLLGAVFLVLWLNGILEAMLYYAAYVPFVGYSTPFDLYQHVLAAVTLLPVWLLAGWACLRVARTLFRGADVADEHLFVGTWAVVLSVPGATAFAGDHKFLFAFPALALLATVALFDGTAKLGGAASGLSEFRRAAPSRETLVAVAFVGLVVAAAGANVVYARALLDTGLSTDAADANAVAAHADGPVYMYPPGNHVFYFTDDVRPISGWLGPTYAPVVVQEVVADLDRQDVQYVAVLRSYTSDGGRIRANDRYWVDTKAPLVAYLNRHYEPVGRTGDYVVYRRTEA